MDITNFGKGGVPQKRKIRDYRFELVAGAAVEEEFEGDKVIFNIKNQGKSLSCVGQAVSAYAEVLNFLETGEKIKLSARDVYSLVYLPSGGAYIADAIKKWRNSGIVTEEDATSYENGIEPSETFMHKRDDITPEEQEEGMSYMAGKYTTWDDKNFDIYRQAIRTGKGVVALAYGNNVCWQNAVLQVPDVIEQCDWCHAIYFCSSIIYMKDGKECLKFLNSWDGWGDGGFGYMPREYFEKGFLRCPTTVLDIPNGTYVSLMSQIKNLQEMISLTKIIIELKRKIAEFLKKVGK